jgi:hypothetical protein
MAVHPIRCFLTEQLSILGVGRGHSHFRYHHTGRRGSEPEDQESVKIGFWDVTLFESAVCRSHKRGA